jgi:hypothetical protein
MHVRGYVKDSAYVAQFSVHLSGFWARIINIFGQLDNKLHRVWNELDYSVDVCKIIFSTPGLVSFL